MNFSRSALTRKLLEFAVGPMVVTALFTTKVPAPGPIVVPITAQDSRSPGHRLAIPGSREYGYLPPAPQSSTVTSTNATLCASPQLQENWAVTVTRGADAELTR